MSAHIHVRDKEGLRSKVRSLLEQSERDASSVRVVQGWGEDLRWFNTASPLTLRDSGRLTLVDFLCEHSPGHTHGAPRAVIPQPPLRRLAAEPPAV